MKQFIGKTMSYLEVGRSQVIGRIIGVVQLLLSFLIYLKIDGQSFSIEFLALLSFFLFVSLILSGWAYMKLGLLGVEIQHRNRHSPEIMETLESVREIKKMLKEVKV